MSDDFIPLNQSTPVGGERWNSRNNQRGFSSRFQNQSGYSPRRFFRGRNHSQRNSRNSSYGSDSSFGTNKSGIDAYLHPSMLQDPWAHLKKQMDNSSHTK